MPRLLHVRSLLLILTILVALVPAGASAQRSRTRNRSRSGPVAVFVRNDRVRFNGSQPIVQNRHLLVPIRGVFEKMGATVTYNRRSRVVTAVRRGRRVHVYVGRITGDVNGQRRRMDAMPILRRGRVHVPLRFLATALNAGVTYYPDQRRVLITPH